MLTAIIIIGLAFAYTCYETKCFTIQLPIGEAMITDTNTLPTPQTMDNPINKDTPYYWQPVKDNMILCQGCRTKCHKDKERWTGWKIPARTIKAWGSTMNFNEGCNIGRAKILRDIAHLQNRKSTVILSGEQVYHRDNGRLQGDYYNDFYEPAIDILVDGELKASINGDYKKGMIADTLKPYTKTVRAGKRILTILKGGHVENMGGGCYVAINGEMKNGEYQYYK